jgi:hypothetical protein
MRRWIPALALMVLVGSACGGPTPTAVASPSVAAAMSASPSQLPESPSPSPTGALSRLVNNTGHFAFNYPKGWVFINCDPATPGVGFAIRAGVHEVSCGNEACWFSMFIISEPGDQTQHATSDAGCMQHVTGQQSTAVTVDGAKGTRITDTFNAGTDQTGGFGPDPGTAQVLYAVYNGSRTYLALYQRAPQQPDETDAFDTLMSSFSFS